MTKIPLKSDTYFHEKIFRYYFFLKSFRKVALLVLHKMTLIKYDKTIRFNVYSLLKNHAFIIILLI